MFCSFLQPLRSDSSRSSNACPNPKEKEAIAKIEPEQKKGKSSIETPLKIQGNKGLKTISSSSYLTDEDADDESLRNDAESERYEYFSGGYNEDDRSRHSRKSQRMRTIKFRNMERTFIRQTSKRSNIVTMA